MARGVLLVTDEPTTIASVRHAMESNGQLQPDDVLGTLDDLAHRLQLHIPPAVIVDLGMHPLDALHTLERLTTRYTDLRIIALSDQVDQDLLLEAMQAGVRRIVPKASIPQTLTDVLDRIGARVAATSSVGRGQIITLLSAGGGCGATTIAVNLANELYLLGKSASLIIDMDECYGAVAAYLGLEGQFGVADVLRDRGRIDSELLRSAALTFNERLSVLLSPVSTNPLNPHTVNHDNLDRMIAACKQTYGYTVIDAPRVPMDVAAELARNSHVVMIVMQLTVKDVHCARQMIAALNSRGVESHQIIPLVNRFKGRKQMLSLEEAQQALQAQRMKCTRNDYASALLGVNFGKPLEAVAPRSSLRRDIADLADTLCPRT